MITQRQRDILTVARERLKLGEAEFGKLVRRWGGADQADDLGPAGYERLIDALLAIGFQAPALVPVISADYLRVICGWVDRLGTGAGGSRLISALVAATGCEDFQSLTGFGFLCVLDALEELGFERSALDWSLRRSVVTPRQLALLHVALKDTGLPDDSYRYMLRSVAGVVTDASDLDEVGFRRAMVFFETKGFVPLERRPKPTKRPTFGRRPGMASPAQITLIREMWAEWCGSDDEDALNAWLERFHHVSALRFLTAGAAGKVITALRAMRRRPAPAKAS